VEIHQQKTKSLDAVDTVSIPAAPENEEGAGSESVSMGYPADGESESMMGLPPQHRPKSPADKRRGERREESSLFDAATVFNLDTDLSSRDIVIVAVLTLAALSGLYQLYRWCINWKLHREYKLVNTSDRAARPSHCIIDGQAYF